MVAFEVGHLTDPNRSRWEAALQKARGGDWSDLAKCLQDKSLTVHQAHRDEIAAILTRGRGRKRDKTKMNSAIGHSYLAFTMALRKSGGKREFAYQYAAETLGVSAVTVRNHVKEVEAPGPAHAMIAMMARAVREIADENDWPLEGWNRDEPETK